MHMKKKKKEQVVQSQTKHTEYSQKKEGMGLL